MVFLLMNGGKGSILLKNFPKDRVLRGIDQFRDLSELHDHLAHYYSHTGRPSIDPELMIRILLISYCFGIRFGQPIFRIGLDDQAVFTGDETLIGGKRYDYMFCVRWGNQTMRSLPSGTNTYGNPQP